MAVIFVGRVLYRSSTDVETTAATAVASLGDMAICYRPCVEFSEKTTVLLPSVRFAKMVQQ